MLKLHDLFEQGYMTAMSVDTTIFYGEYINDGIREEDLKILDIPAPFTLDVSGFFYYKNGPEGKSSPFIEEEEVELEE